MEGTTNHIWADSIQLHKQIKSGNRIDLHDFTYNDLSQLMILLLKINKDDSPMEMYDDILNRLKKKLTPYQQGIMSEKLNSPDHTCPHNHKILLNLLLKDMELGNTLESKSNGIKETILYLHISNIFPSRKNITPSQIFSYLEDLQKLNMDISTTKEPDQTLVNLFRDFRTPMDSDMQFL